ncbi:hypothetical protein [Kordiimonas gwangyangensis]|uniref:hypothetical protein n=1 Tax=Kordiimonas gwangyangensis TaxID=288022 RepID=UPI000AB78DF2|nr:hypothetical protein [Kordiimonas gwangyangensis]
MTDNFHLHAEGIESRLRELANRDDHVARALDLVGIPDTRPAGEQSFHTFMRVIVGQQLSVKAAATIRDRVEALVGPGAGPKEYARVADEDLRAAGLSRQKISYARSLCDVVNDGTLVIERCQA